jgi:transcriptional regulator with XRE-family HTH domain
MDDTHDLSDRIGRALRVQRAALGLSLGDVARSSGLSKTILARIERGEGNPSIDTLWRLSQALGIPLGAMLAEPESPRVRAFPARSGHKLTATSGMDAWLVHTESRALRSELFDLALPKGADQRSGAHLPGTEELIYCVTGRIQAGRFGEEVELGPADAVWFVADSDHHYVGLEESRLLCWMLYAAAL